MTSTSSPQEMYHTLSHRFREEADEIGGQEGEIALKAIETVNTPLYATLGWQESGSEEVAQRIHTLVRNEVMYVLFLDKFHETSQEHYRHMADACRERVRTALSAEQNKQLTALEKKLFVYWDVERDMSSRMSSGDATLSEDIRELTLRKSTDVFAYATLLRTMQDVPKEVVLELYAHQLLRDVQDDIADLEEDAQEHMPNPLLLRLFLRGDYYSHVKYDQQQLEKMARSMGVIEEQQQLVRDYCRTISASLPPQYEWMRECAGVEVSL